MASSWPTPPRWAAAPAPPALVLAGAQSLGRPKPDGTPGSDFDGLATALEVSGMNLWGTQLVVLSACDTGCGTTLPGQGVYGYLGARAHQYSSPQIGDQNGW